MSRDRDLNELRGWAAARYAQAIATPGRIDEPYRPTHPVCVACQLVYSSHHRADGLCLDCGHKRDGRRTHSRRRPFAPEEARIPRRRGRLPGRRT